MLTFTVSVTIKPSPFLPGLVDLSAEGSDGQGPPASTFSVVGPVERPLRDVRVVQIRGREAGEIVFLLRRNWRSLLHFGRRLSGTGGCRIGIFRVQLSFGLTGEIPPTRFSMLEQIG